MRRLLRDAKDLQNAIIFCNRKREVAVVYKSLQKHGFSVGALHGDMDQSARTAALDQFRKGEIPLLVASDVAARGLDIPAVSHVFNFDVPHHADDYVHRIGRTGRAGRAGTAISIVTSLDNKSIAAIEKLIGQNIPARRGRFAVIVVRRRDSRASIAPRSVPGNVRAAAQAATEREPRPRRSRGEPQAAAASVNASRGRPQARAAVPARKAAARPQPSSRRPLAAFARAFDRPSRNRGRAQREAESEPADHSHLPAFLLRPVRARVCRSRFD